MADRIRVLRLIARMNIGGPAWQVKMLADGLDPERFEQRIVYGDLAEGEMDFFSLPGTDLPDHVPSEYLAGFGRSVRPFDDFRTLRALRNQIRTFRPHIVHTHTAKAGTLGRIANLRRGRAATVHSFHGHVLDGYFSPVATWGVTAVERALAHATDMFFAEGSVVRDELQERGIGRNKPWKVIVPGLNAGESFDRIRSRESFGLQTDAPVIGFVGRLTKIKRPDRLAEVFQRVRTQIPRAQLLVAGDGEMLNSFRESLRGDLQAATLLGFTGRVPEVLAASDVVILTSDNEGMPYTLVEAQMAGRPVVTTAVGSVCDVVQDGVTGRICSADPADLAGAVIELLSDPALWQEYSTAASSWSRSQFSTARLAKDVGDAYELVLANRRGKWDK